MIKTCNKCEKPYPATTEYFYQSPQNNDGLRYWCKGCCSKSGKEFYSQPVKRNARKKRARINNLKLYDLTPDEHLKMYVAQNGCCFICRKAVLYSKIYVDHNHETGKTRRLLCCYCNNYLSLVENNPELIKKMQEYLRSQK